MLASELRPRNSIPSSFKLFLVSIYPANLVRYFRDDEVPKSGGGGLAISFRGGLTVNSACRGI